MPVVTVNYHYLHSVQYFWPW